MHLSDALEVRVDSDSFGSSEAPSSFKQCTAVAWAATRPAPPKSAVNYSHRRVFEGSARTNGTSNGTAVKENTLKLAWNVLHILSSRSCLSLAVPPVMLARAAALGTRSEDLWHARREVGPGMLCRALPVSISLDHKLMLLQRAH